MMSIKSQMIGLLVAALLPGVSMAQPIEPVPLPSAQGDSRISLHMTPEERTEFLASMRVMLGSVQGILRGIATDDRALIERSAKLSGNQMARATPDALRKRLPLEFAELGAPTHLAFEEMAVRAETDPRNELTRLMADTMNQCMACHARFKAD